MPFLTKALTPVSAGDLIYCATAGRAGFARRSADVGDDVEIVDSGIYAVSLADRAGAEQECVYVSDIGAPVMSPTARPLGVITAIHGENGRIVSVELNV